MRRYGLQMENNKPTHRYSKDERIARHKGNWIEKYAVSYCSELGVQLCNASYQLRLTFYCARMCCKVSDHDEELVDLLLEGKGETRGPAIHENAVVEFCEGTMNVCLSSERDLLGDWDGDGTAKHSFPTVDLPKDYL